MLVIRRDVRCVVCNTLQNRQVHHINSMSYFPEQVFIVENGTCLCKTCHTNLHTNFHRSYRVKTTRYDFENFLSLMEQMKAIFLLEKAKEDLKSLGIKGTLTLEEI